MQVYSSDDEFIQVGSWVYDAGKELAAHVHNEVPRQVTHTQEVIFVRRGRLVAQIYSAEGALVRELTAATGDVLILLRGAHGYRILDAGTEVLEVKNGPYPGAERDRTRLTDSTAKGVNS